VGFSFKGAETSWAGVLVGEAADCQISLGHDEFRFSVRYHWVLAAQCDAIPFSQYDRMLDCVHKHMTAPMFEFGLRCVVLHHRAPQIMEPL